MLAEFEERGAEAIGPWLAAPRDGRIKLWVTAAALRLRRARGALFDRGVYQPLAARGKAAENVFAFARIDGDEAALAVVGRFFTAWGAARPLGDTWGDARLALPAALSGRRFRDGLTGRTFEADGDSLSLASIFACLPVALLETMS
jgi:(1->4)-alpha-D-glucan 1-alpha-D-glucosylmutase